MIALHTQSLAGRVHLKAGVYEIRDTVPIRHPLHLTGEPGTVVRGSGYLFRAMASDVRFEGLRFVGYGAVQFLDTTIPATEGRGRSGWKWRDCVFDRVPLTCMATHHSTPSGGTIEQGSDVVEAIRLTDCEFSNVRAASVLQFNQCRDAVVRGCRFVDGGISGDAGDAVKVASGSQDVVIRDCLIDGSTRDGIDVFDSTRVLVGGCTIRNCAKLGYEAKWGSSNNPTVVAHHKVLGTRFERCGDTGCSMSASYGTVHGCDAIDCGTGFRINPAHNGERTTQVNMCGNTALRCKRGYWINGDQSVFAGNVSDAAERYGVVWYGHDCQEGSNAITGSGLKDWLRKTRVAQATTATDKAK